MTSRKFNYLVIEDAVESCEGIERRMQAFKTWHSLGYCRTAREALQKISSSRPELIFLDWNLNGGSAYDVLAHIQTIPFYDPYVIFNTAFQSDHPDIPEAITNTYRVDKYLVKPIWEKLRLQLPAFLKEAEEKVAEQHRKTPTIWIVDDNKAKIPLPIEKISCIIQNVEHPRKRDFYIVTSDKKITIPISWEKCYELLNDNLISYFVTKTREHLVVRKYVEKYEKPFVRVCGIPAKIEVVKEKTKAFGLWLEQGLDARNASDSTTVTSK